LEADTAVHEPVKVNAELVSSTVVFVTAPFAEGAKRRSRRKASAGSTINECGDPMGQGGEACKQAGDRGGWSS
jgi:hypothetical protein